MSVKRLLLWLWRELPLPRQLRWVVMWLGNTKFLIGALAAIFDEEGRILLQRHTYRKRYPWGMPGGWIQGGEHPAEALAREVVEETGLTIAVGPLIAARRGRREPRIVLTYLCTASGKPGLSVETSEIAYFALDALPPDLSPDQREPLRIAARVRAHLRRQPPAPGEETLWDIGGAGIGDDEEYE